MFFIEAYSVAVNTNSNTSLSQKFSKPLLIFSQPFIILKLLKEASYLYFKALVKKNLL